MSKRIKLIAAAVATGMSFGVVSSHAADVDGHYKIGYDGGGKTLVTVVFTDGSSENIKSNAGFFFGGGVSIVNSAKTLETEIALTYKIDDISATNGDVTWSRWPVDVLGFFRFGKVRVGGGLTYHLNPKLDGSGVTGGLNVKFKDSLGAIVQVDYRITDKMNIGLRYTDIDYEFEGTGGSVSSNGIGLVFSGSF